MSLPINLTTYFSTLWNFFGDVSICKHRTWQNVRKSLNFLPQPPHMISWPLEKFRNFQTSFEFYTFLKPFYLTIFIMIRGQNDGQLAWFHIHGLRDVSWTWISFFTNFTLWFYALAVHIGRIRKNCLERSKIVKNSKQS